MATHSSTLAWKIPWTEEPGKLQSMGSSEESDTTEWLHFHFHALEKEMATHSSVLAWRIPGTGEPGGLTSMRSHRVRQDWSDLAAASAATYLFNKYFLNEPCGKELHNFKYSFYQNCLCFIDLQEITETELVKQSDSNNMALFVLYIKIPQKILCDLRIPICKFDYLEKIILCILFYLQSWIILNHWPEKRSSSYLRHRKSNIYITYQR